MMFRINNKFEAVHLPVDDYLDVVDVFHSPQVGFDGTSTIYDASRTDLSGKFCQDLII